MSGAVQGGAGVGHDPLGLEREAVVGCPAGQLACPQAADLLAAFSRLEPAGRGGSQGVQGPADVGLDADLDVIVGVHLGRDATQVQDPLVTARVDPHRIELLQFIADADDHVRLVETEVDIVVAHEPHRAKRVRVVVREHPLAVKGGSHRQAQLLGEAPYSGRRVGPGRPVPGQDDGQAGPVEHRRSPLDLRRRGLVRPGNVEAERG